MLDVGTVLRSRYFIVLGSGSSGDTNCRNCLHALITALATRPDSSANSAFTE